MYERRDVGAGIGVFLAASIFFAWLAGNRLVLVNDEGIYLDGAVNILHGSLPYRDFFALTGPGTFWNLAVLFEVFGVSLASARALLIADLASITVCIYWLLAKFHSRSVALWVCGIYVAVLAADRGSLVVNHRWDSTACGMIAVTCFVHNLRSGRAWALLVAGAVSAYAGWVTPPMGLIALVLLAWAVVRMPARPIAVFLAGFGTISLAAFVTLAWSSSWVPLARALVWTGSQYSAANRFAYGAIIGGYPQLFEDAHGIEFVFRVFLVFFVALPALLPVFGVILYSASRALRRGPQFLVPLCGVAAVVGCFPRMDNGHLIYAAPFWYVGTGIAVGSLAPRRLRVALVLLGSLGGALFVFTASANRTGLSNLNSRSGELVAEAGDVSLVRDLEISVNSNEGFFAFPYLPIAYFLTRGTNPTRYSFLQPGMMSDSDERHALEALKRAPPRRALYMHVPESAYLRLFPSSDPARLRMPRIEAWLNSCYEPSGSFSLAHPGYEMLSWRGTRGGACPAAHGYN